MTEANQAALANKIMLADSLKRHSSDNLKIRAVLRLYRQWGYIDNQDLQTLLKTVK